MAVESLLPGTLESVAAGLPDGFAATGVLVVGSHVSDRFVQPHGIVFRSYSCKFGCQQRWLGDGLQLRPLGLDVAGERLEALLSSRGDLSRCWCGGGSSGVGPHVSDDYVGELAFVVAARATFGLVSVALSGHVGLRGWVTADLGDVDDMQDRVHPTVATAVESVSAG